MSFDFCLIYKIGQKDSGIPSLKSHHFYLAHKMSFSDTGYLTVFIVVYLKTVPEKMFISRS